MMRWIVAPAVLLIALGAVAVAAETYTIGDVAYTLPEGWSVASEELIQGALPTVRLNHGTDVLMITFMLGLGKQFAGQEQQDAFLVAQAAPIEANSLEGKTTVQHMATEQIRCCYAMHTDKNLVGKPVVPNDWKYTVVGFGKIGDSLVHFTYFTNDRGTIAKGKGLDVIRTMRPAAAEPKQDTFAYEFKEHQVRIAVPEIPGMKLKPHPFRKAQPHLRYMGSTKAYNLSIITPTVGLGMTPEEFAKTRSEELVRMHALATHQYLLRQQPESECYAMYYYLLTGSFVQLHAHLFSVSPLRKHGIEVHISRTDSNKDGIGRWLAGFPKATIEKSAAKAAE